MKRTDGIASPMTTLNHIIVVILIRQTHVLGMI